LGIASDTIVYYREANISELDRQKQFVSTVKKGVLPLLLQSTLVDKITYDVDAPQDSTASNSTDKDPWNYWSFELGLNLNVRGESSFMQQGIFTNIAASRIRKESKTNIWTWYNYDESQFTLSDGEVVESFNRRLGLFVRQVWSINDHWSYGFIGFAGSSTFGNIDVELRPRAAVEYNIFPYSDNSTRRFTLRYSNGAVHPSLIASRRLDGNMELTSNSIRIKNGEPCHLTSSLNSSYIISTSIASHLIPTSN